MCTKKTKIKTLLNNFFSFMSVFDTRSQKYHNATILTMSLLPFWALNAVVALLYMQGQKALGFHKEYLNLCSKDERRSHGFGMTWEWVINDIIFIIGWTIPSMYVLGLWLYVGASMRLMIHRATFLSNVAWALSHWEWVTNF